MLKELLKEITEMPLSQLTKELKAAGVKFVRNEKYIKYSKSSKYSKDILRNDTEMLATKSIFSSSLKNDIQKKRKPDYEILEKAA